MLASLLLLGLEPSAASWLEVRDCPELDQPRLIELTALELVQPPTTIRAELRCNEEGFDITLRRDDGQALRRRVPAASAAAERYLAVELVELVELLLGTPAPSPEPAPPPPPEPPPEPSPEPSPESPATGRLWLSGAARFELGGDPLLPSGGLQVELGGRPWSQLELRVHAGALGGARRLDDDGVRMARVLAGGSVLWIVHTERLDLPVGAGARASGSWLQGQPNSDLVGRTHRGVSWSPFVTVGLRGPSSSRLFATADIRAGWTLRAVRGLRGQEVALSTGGPWIGVSLGLGGWLIR